MSDQHRRHLSHQAYTRTYRPNTRELKASVIVAYQVTVPHTSTTHRDCISHTPSQETQSDLVRRKPRWSSARLAATLEWRDPSST